ncbi:MAG: hypothetical protein HY577_01575 [Candidatus Nealsonbacteria bacterium]|nr:hypothetical protein [Candidatus Nealsonbacteria bacterium]
MFQKILVVDIKEERTPPSVVERLKKLTASVGFISRDDQNFKKSLSDTDIILCSIFTKIDKEVIDNAPCLKYIGVLSTAFDAIDATYARSKNISVCNLGGYSTEAVAEFFFATLFEVTRELERAKGQAWQQDYSFDKFMQPELKGKTLGVIGAGKIGGRTAEIGLGVGLKVVYFDKVDKPNIEKFGAKRVELNELLSQSDFISLNLILNGETEGIISREKLALLKKNCVFISLAPPRLVDQEAIIERANQNEMTFVFDHSDDIDTGLAKRFLETKNVIVYPPVAFRTKEADATKWETFASNIEGFSRGNLQNVVNQ